MLRTLSEPEGYKLIALDGDIGHCHDFLFDDIRWTLRYMVADTGGWLTGRKVLISPAHLESPDWETRHFPVRLTRQQIEDSPPLDSDAPVSRRYERTYHDFFTTHYYWTGEALWGNYPFPGMTVPSDPEPPAEPPEVAEENPDEIHLRSMREVTGYKVAAKDGEAGRIVDFVADDTTWALRFAVVEWSRLPVSRKVLVAVDWIEELSWVDRQLRVDISVEQIEGAPEFDPGAPVNEKLETVVYDYYGRRRGKTAESP